MENVIGFSNELHIPIFDPIVDHFYIMTCTARPHVSYAWLSSDLGTDRFEYWFHQSPCFRLTSRHDGRSPQCSLLTTTHTSPDIYDPFRFQCHRPAFRVQEEAVAAIN